MKILCSLSSLEFSCEHFPGALYSRETSHPVFSLPQKKLLSYLHKWSSGELTSIDSYLLFLALLNSSDLVQFRVPAIRTERTASIIAQNMEDLAKTVIKLNTVTVPGKIFPHFVISQDTKTLDNVHYWIENWKDSYSDFQAGVLTDLEGRDEWKKLANREAALERLIKNPHRPLSDYASQIAEWASVAGNFPNGTVPSPFTGLQISLSDYWKFIIIKSSTESALYSIPKQDLEDLLEHCETHINIGTIFSNALFKILRNALTKQRNFIGLGDKDIGRVRIGDFTILDPDASTEDANMAAIVASAPDHLPQRDEYPSKFEYMRAKLRYDMSLKMKRKEV